MGQSKQTRMASVRLLLFVTASASAQFVFFGNHHGPPRALGSQPAPAPAREARVLVQPQPVQQPAQAQPVQPTIQRFQQRPAINSGVTANSDSRFAPTFFRPLTKLHHPGKNALPESDEPAKFVKILSDPDLILTEEGGVRRTTEAPHMMEIKKMMEMMEREREGRLVVEDAMVSLPQFVTPAPTIATTQVTTTTTPAPTTTSPPETTVVVKTMAPFNELERTAAPVARPAMTFFDVTTPPPMTTTRPRAPTTTPAPVTTTTTVRAVVTTAKPMMRIVSSVRSSPFTLGSPRVTQLNQSPRMSQFPTVSNSPVPSQPAAAAPRAPKALPATPSRAQVKGNHQFQGKSYLLTWRMGRNNFDWTGGVRFCQSQGMQLVSPDNKEKTEHFLRLLTTDRAPYFWSGGQVSRDSRSLSWPSGKTDPIARGQHPWSFTGRTGPQPDGGERCLAVLNNTYRDGVKFHDVACHHRKPVICEEV